MKPRVMIVDDEKRLTAVVSMALKRSGYECLQFQEPTQALAAFGEEGADVVVTDWKMPGMDGLQLMGELHVMDPGLPVILMTAFADVPSAVSAIKQGAFHYITKPFDNDDLRGLVARAMEVRQLHRENRTLREELKGRYSADSIVAQSVQSKALLDLIRRVAPTRAPVLIQGESGTGKELVARLLHFWSERVGAPFVPINCKSFAPGVLESELFGHEKGAFTGATATRAGCFERADRGTLFLDEIGEIHPDFQGKLLRVLETGEVLRVGGEKSRHCDVRIVAATNRVLRDEIDAGRFREDLFFRLNVIPIQLTPLRERVDDILPLARFFLARHHKENGRALALHPDAQQHLLKHPWPGNVRELENAMERAVILTRSDQIHSEDLLLEALPASSKHSAHTSSMTLQESLDQTTRERIEATLRTQDGQKAEAARALGIDRTTLYRLCKRLGISS